MIFKYFAPTICHQSAVKTIQFMVSLCLIRWTPESVKREIILLAEFIVAIFKRFKEIFEITANDHLQKDHHDPIRCKIL